MSVLDRARGPARQRRPIRRWRSRRGLLVPTAEALAEALASIPEGAPWPWACFRVLPMVRGERVPYLSDDDLDELGFEPASAFPSVSMPPGVDVTFAIEVEPALLNIHQARLDAWDMTLDGLAGAAFANLRRVVGTWPGRAYEDDSYADAPVRMLAGWPYWAVSLVLLPNELQRIFGSHDQLFVAPYHCNLISLPIDVDRDVAADLVDLFGYVNPQSLLLGLPAFVLRQGELSVEELPGLQDAPDHWADGSADEETGEGEERPGILPA